MQDHCLGGWRVILAQGAQDTQAACECYHTVKQSDAVLYVMAAPPDVCLCGVCPQIAGGQRYRPPAVDVNAPDLFIPLMGLWSYALLSCVVLAFKHAFKPESMSSTVSSRTFF